MRGTTEWPLPSESRHVRAFFYLADGLAAAGGVIILLGLSASSLFLLHRAVSDVTATGGVALVVFAFGYVIVHRIAAFREASRTRSADPPEAKDWGRTRDRTTVGAVALLVALVGVALMVGLWTSLRALVLAVLVPFALVQVGLLLRLYGFHRLGVRVL